MLLNLAMLSFVWQSCKQHDQALIPYRRFSVFNPQLLAFFLFAFVLCLKFILNTWEFMVVSSIRLCYLRGLAIFFSVSFINIAELLLMIQTLYFFFT